VVAVHVICFSQKLSFKLLFSNLSLFVFSEKHFQISTHMVTGKLCLVPDEEVLPEGSGAGLRQRVDVPVVQEVVGLSEWTEGEI
jgi:hypothetical protein